MKDIERKFEANKALMERDAYNAQLEEGDAAFNRGRVAIMSLVTRAAYEFDGGKGMLIPDWEVLLQWVDVLEWRDVNTYAWQKEEARRGWFALIRLPPLSLNPLLPRMCLRTQ